MMDEKGRPEANEVAMDEQEQREVNESERLYAEAQALNAQLTQQFFADVINNLRTQTEDNRAMTQELADQQRRTQEAGRALTQGSVGAYMDFVNATFSFYQGSVKEEEEEGAEVAQRGTTETDTSTGGERVESQEAGGGGLPIEAYDSLGVKQIRERWKS